MNIYTPNTLPKNWSDTFATKNDKPSLTEQTHKADSDINIIMQRYRKTGQLPIINNKPVYGDFTMALDYRSAMDEINKAKDAFGGLNAKIRKEFDNDPAKFLDFMDDPKNEDEARRLGILPKKVDTPPAPNPDAPKDEPK